MGLLFNTSTNIIYFEKVTSVFSKMFEFNCLLVRLLANSTKPSLIS